MKVYMVAITSGPYMYPVGHEKLYKSKAAAEKYADKYKQDYPKHAKDIKVLVADDWHEE